MGKYILLEFDDNAEAAAFFKRLKGLKEVEDGQSFEDNALHVAATLLKANPLAVYTKPTELCDCKSDLDNSLRGRKLGWWVCPNCKKPKDRQGQTLRNILNPKLTNTTRVGSPNLSVRWRRDEDGKVITSIES